MVMPLSGEATVPVEENPMEKQQKDIGANHSQRKVRVEKGVNYDD